MSRTSGGAFGPPTCVIVASMSLLASLRSVVTSRFVILSAPVADSVVVAPWVTSTLSAPVTPGATPADIARLPTAVALLPMMSPVDVSVALAPDDTPAKTMPLPNRLRSPFAAIEPPRPR
jgi:hypothetical protein